MSTQPPMLDQELHLVTESLRRLESQLVTDSSAHQDVLTEFRDALNRMRIAGWIVQRAASEREGVTQAQLLAQERVRCMTRMSEQVSEFFGSDDGRDLEGMETLLDNMEELSVHIRVHLQRVRGRHQFDLQDQRL